MATIRVGDDGNSYDTQPRVRRGFNAKSVTISCPARGKARGTPVVLRMSREEAMVLLADLAEGLAGRDIPLKECEKPIRSSIKPVRFTGGVVVSSSKSR